MHSDALTITYKISMVLKRLLTQGFIVPSTEIQY